ALLTLLAGRADVATPPVVAAASIRGDAIIVLSSPPTAFSALDDDALDDGTLRRIWSAADQLHKARLCHGELTLDWIGGRDDEVVVSGFALGTMTSTDAEIAHENATLLTSQALRVGPERAVAAALSAMESEAVAEARAYLQRPALPHRLRSSSGPKALLEGAQAEITERTGGPPAEPAPRPAGRRR